MRCAWRDLAALLSMAGCLWVGVASAETVFVDIPEKYSDDPGGYRPGKFGQAMYAAQFGVLLPMEYPVLFPRKSTTEGTVSVWFKTPQVAHWWSWGNVNDFIRLSDGANELAFYLRSGPAAKKGERPGLYIGARTKGTAWKGVFKPCLPGFHQSFHHLLFTWNDDGILVLLDGEVWDQSKDRFPAWDGVKASMSIVGSTLSPVIMDEYVILSRSVSLDEARILHTRATPWQPDDGTALYLGFDGSHNAKAAIRVDGDVIRCFTQVGRCAPTFFKGEPIAFKIFGVNMTSTVQSVSVGCQIDDVSRKAVASSVKELKIESGRMSSTPLDVDVKATGLFWANLRIVDGQGREIDKERIPYAKAFVPSYPRSASPLGNECPEGMNPPPFEGWTKLGQWNWCNAEYEPGKFAFDVLDMQVDDVVRTGRHPIIQVLGTPRYTVTDEHAAQQAWEFSEPPDDMEAYKRYVRTIGERYKGKVFDYEVYNEPAFMKPEIYAGLVNTAAGILHAIDPKIRVIGCIFGGEVWKRTMMRETAGKADYYSIHPYSLANPDYAEKDDDSWIAGVRELLRQQGANPILATTEIHDSNIVRFGYDQRGYPMTIDELASSGVLDKLNENAYHRSYWSGKQPWNHFQSAGICARSVVMQAAGGCEYVLWMSIYEGTPIAHLPQAPSPAWLGFANVAGLMATHDYARSMPGPGYKLYLFKNKTTKAPLLIAWANTTPVSIFLDLRGEVGVTDLFGQPVKQERFGDVIKLNLALSPVFLSGLFEVPEGLGKPLARMELTPKTMFPGETGTLKAVVSNPLPEPLSGRLAVVLPAGFQALDERTIKLEAHGSCEELFKLLVPAGTLGALDAQVTFTPDMKAMGPVSVSDRLSVKQNAMIERLRTTPKLDADLTEWGDPAKFPMVADKPSQVTVGTPVGTLGFAPYVTWNGANDCSLRAKLTYDDEALYVIARVFDDKLMNTISRAQNRGHYEGDSIELFIDGRAPEAQGESCYTNEVYKLNITPGGVDYPDLPTQTVFTVTQPVYHDLGLTLGTRFYPDGYSVVARIPFAKMPSLKVQSGASFGFDIAVNDKDSTQHSGGVNVQGGGRKCQLTWAGDGTSFKNPAVFGRVTFGK